MLCIGRPENIETLGSGSPKNSDLRLGGAIRLGVDFYA